MFTRMQMVLWIHFRRVYREVGRFLKRCHAKEPSQDATIVDQMSVTTRSAATSSDYSRFGKRQRRMLMSLGGLFRIKRHPTFLSSWSSYAVAIQRTGWVQTLTKRL